MKERGVASGTAVGTGRSPSSESGSLVLPSRTTALDACRAALARNSGPLLLTGEAGAGKTWLWNRLAADWQEPWSWVGVDLSPSDAPIDLIGKTARAMGLVDPSKTALADALRESDREGRRWALVVDEAQNGTLETLEEVRLLANRLARPDGFSAILLVGQTPLVGRFETRPLSALESRLTARVHLGPIDADEAFELLARLFPDRSWDRASVERRHRSSSGNPARLLRLARQTTESMERSEVSVEAPSEPPARLGDPRPPILLEENLIEVGWEPELEEPSAGEVANGQEPSREVVQSLEEPVDDRYAALQAWNEWAKNHDRQGTDSPVVEATAVEVEDEGKALDRSPTSSPNHWADSQHEFAPYSQLFSRLRQAKNAE